MKLVPPRFSVSGNSSDWWKSKPTQGCSQSHDRPPLPHIAARDVHSGQLLRCDVIDIKDLRGPGT